MEAAEEVLREAIRRRPRDWSSYLLLTEILEQQRRFPEALHVYNTAWKKGCDYSTLWYNLGCLLLTTGACPPAPVIASEAFETALDLDPGDAAAWNNLGVAYRREGAPAEAVEAFQRALSLRPEYAAARFNLGAALHTLGRLAEAEAEYREALRLAPDDALTQGHLALLFVQRGDREQACEAAREALRPDPADGEASRLLAKALWELGDREAALAAYRDGIVRELQGGVPASDLGLARFPASDGALVRAAHWYGALAWLESMRVGSREDVTGWLQNALGLSHLTQGPGAGAAAAFRAAIERDPRQPGYHENLALALRACGDLAVARAAVGEALRLAPERAAAHFLHGLLQLDERPAEAAASFRAALARCPADPELHAALAVALAGAGDPAAAEPHWQAALLLDLKPCPVAQGRG